MIIRSLPARELKHPNPLRLRIIGATQHGKYPTHDWNEMNQEGEERQEEEEN